MSEQRALLFCCRVSPQVPVTFKIGRGLLLTKPEVFRECKQIFSCSQHCTGVMEKYLEGFVCL